MSGFLMNVDLFGNAVACDTDGNMVNLNQLANAGNAWRLSKGLAIYQLGAFLSSAGLQEYITAAAGVWGLEPEAFLRKAGKGKTSRTMGHISVALLLGEQMSPVLHATIHKVFIEGKLLEFREYGSTEFKNVNIELDKCMVAWEGRHAHKGHFVQMATLLRKRLLNDGQDWNTASVAQTHRRWEAEQTLVKLLQLGVVRDWEHLKELIEKV